MVCKSDCDRASKPQLEPSSKWFLELRFWWHPSELLIAGLWMIVQFTHRCVEYTGIRQTWGHQAHVLLNQTLHFCGGWLNLEPCPHWNWCWCHMNSQVLRNDFVNACLYVCQYIRVSALFAGPVLPFLIYRDVGRLSAEDDSYSCAKSGFNLSMSWFICTPTVQLAPNKSMNM